MSDLYSRPYDKDASKELTKTWAQLEAERAERDLGPEQVEREADESIDETEDTDDRLDDDSEAIPYEDDADKE